MDWDEMFREQKQEYKILRHDLANHLQVLSGLRKEDSEAVLDYKNEIYNSYLSLGVLEREFKNGDLSEGRIKGHSCQDPLTWNDLTLLLKHLSNHTYDVATGNQALDIMLNQKIEICNENNIKVGCRLLFPKSYIVNSADLIGLVGNLFDNAIEACIRTIGPKSIHLSSWIKQGVFMVKIVNSKPSENPKSGVFRTWKENRGEHGLGMKIIEEIVNKYEGFIEYKNESDRFVSIAGLLLDMRE